MESGTVWLGLAGLLVMAVLMSRSFKGSIITGIIFVTVIAWIPGHAASYLGSASPIPGN
jgi:adenine/guanine/hypoxanthine permease